MNRVKELRESRGLNQRELSELAHTPQSLISSIEREVMKPWYSVAMRLSSVLDTPIPELFPDDSHRLIDPQSEKINRR